MKRREVIRLIKRAKKIYTWDLYNTAIWQCLEKYGKYIG